MLSPQADAVTLDLDGGGASGVRLGGCNRRGLVGARGSQGRSTGSIGSLALFRSRPWRYSTHERRRMSRPSGECRFKSLTCAMTPAPPSASLRRTCLPNPDPPHKLATDPANHLSNWEPS